MAAVMGTTLKCLFVARPSSSSESTLGEREVVPTRGNDPPALFAARQDRCGKATIANWFVGDVVHADGDTMGVVNTWQGAHRKRSRQHRAAARRAARRGGSCQEARL